MALLFAAIAVEAIAGVPVSSTALDVLRRMPLLLATTGIACLVGYGPRRHSELRASQHPSEHPSEHADRRSGGAR